MRWFCIIQDQLHKREEEHARERKNLLEQLDKERRKLEKEKNSIEKKELEVNVYACCIVLLTIFSHKKKSQITWDIKQVCTMYVLKYSESCVLYQNLCYKRMRVIVQYTSAIVTFHWRIETSHEIMVLFVLCKLILQTRMRNHPVRLDVWCLIRPFVYFHTSCVRTAKALARLRSTIILWAGSLTLQSNHHIRSETCVDWRLFLYAKCISYMQIEMPIFMHLILVLALDPTVLLIDWNVRVNCILKYRIFLVCSCCFFFCFVFYILFLHHNVQFPPLVIA